MSRGIKRAPEIEPEAREYLFGLSKSTLMEILRDFAIRHVGEDVESLTPLSWVEAVKETHRILKENGLSK